MQRLDRANARIIEKADGVIILCNSEEGLLCWQQIIADQKEEFRNPIDQSTENVEMRRDSPVEIIALMQSSMSSHQQIFGISTEEIGTVTQLDRGLSNKPYNPVVFLQALLLSESARARTTKEGKK